MRGGAKRSRGTDDEAEGHEAEDGEEGGYREAGESVHSTAGGGRTNDNAVRVGARGEQMEVNSTATVISVREGGGKKARMTRNERRREKARWPRREDSDRVTPTPVRRSLTSGQESENEREQDER